MTKISVFYRLLSVIILIVIASCGECTNDQVYHHGECIQCYRLDHTIQPSNEERRQNSCSCTPGY